MGEDVDGLLRRPRRRPRRRRARRAGLGLHRPATPAASAAITGTRSPLRSPTPAPRCSPGAPRPAPRAQIAARFAERSAEVARGLDSLEDDPSGPRRRPRCSSAAAMRVTRPSVAADAVRAVTALVGRPVRVLRACCGLPLLHAGDREASSPPRAASPPKPTARRASSPSIPAAPARSSSSTPGSASTPPQPELFIDLAARNRAPPAAPARTARLPLARSLSARPRARPLRRAARHPRPARRPRPRSSSSARAATASAAAAAACSRRRGPTSARAIADARVAEHRALGGGVLVTGCAQSLHRFRRAGEPAEDIVSLVRARPRALRMTGSPERLPAGRHPAGRGAAAPHRRRAPARQLPAGAHRLRRHRGVELPSAARRRARRRAAPRRLRARCSCSIGEALAEQNVFDAAAQPHHRPPRTRATSASGSRPRAARGRSPSRGAQGGRATALEGDADPAVRRFREEIVARGHGHRGVAGERPGALLQAAPGARVGRREGAERARNDLVKREAEGAQRLRAMRARVEERDGQPHRRRRARREERSMRAPRRASACSRCSSA